SSSQVKAEQPSAPPTRTCHPERIRQGCAKDLNANAIAEPSVPLRFTKPCAQPRPIVEMLPCGVRRLAAAFAQSAIQKPIVIDAIIQPSPLTKLSALLKSKWIRPARRPPARVILRPA